MCYALFLEQEDDLAQISEKDLHDTLQPVGEISRSLTRILAKKRGKLVLSPRFGDTCNWLV
jgi:hypothetical protein